MEFSDQVFGFLNSTAESLTDAPSQILIGLVAGYGANALTQLVKSIRYNRNLKSLEGAYLQVSFDQPDNLISIAEFFYNMEKNQYEYNGTNYRNDGTANYEWQTKVLLPCLEENKILYFYRFRNYSKPYQEKEGLGVINIGKKGSRLTFKRNGSYFFDIENPFNVHYYRMTNLKDIEKSFGMVCIDDNQEVGHLVKWYIKHIKETGELETIINERILENATKVYSEQSSNQQPINKYLDAMNILDAFKLWDKKKGKVRVNTPKS